MKYAVVAALALLCAACGQKGPLYLPKPAGTAVPPDTSSTTPAPAPGTSSAGTAAHGEDTDPNSSQKQKGSTAP